MALDFTVAGLSAATIKTQVRSVLNESSALYWTDDDLDTWINEACLDISKRTLCVQKTGVITASTVQVTPYDASDFAGISDFGQVAKFHTLLYQDTSEGTLVSLIRINPRSVGFLNPYISGTSVGTPKYWYIYGDKLYIYPTITTIVALEPDFFTLYYSAVTQTLTDIFSPLHPLIIDYCLYCAKLKEENQAEAMQFFSKYQNSLMFARQDIFNRGLDSKVGTRLPDNVQIGG